MPPGSDPRIVPATGRYGGGVVRYNKPWATQFRAERAANGKAT